MKKAISYMACSMAAMLALSACGSAASSASTVASSSDAASTESTAASEASNEPVTITFAQYSGSGDNEQYLQQMVDNYMKENPNVTIDLQTYGYDDYFTQMTAKVAGGQAPDVFELDYQNFVSYAKKGALMPLDDILTKDGIDTSIYNDMALKAFSADGVQYGVPDSFSNVVLIYNKDLFDQAGIDYPTDDWKWEDAMAAAEKIRALGDNIFGYYHPISFNEFYKTVILVAPLLEENQTAREVYLPEGEWYAFFTGKCYHGCQTISTTADMKFPVFIRGGYAVPLHADGMDSLGNPVSQNLNSKLILLVAGAAGKSTFTTNKSVLTCEWKNEKVRVEGTGAETVQIHHFC